MAKYHKITGNESVGTIAGMYGVTPQTLLAANPGVSTLSAGAYLRVPTIQSATTQGVSWNGTNPMGGAGANPPKTQNPLDKVLNVFSGIGETLSNVKFSSDSVLGQTRTPYPGYNQNGVQSPTQTPKTNGNLNAQQIAELNLANARNTFKPSSNLLNWNQQISSGVATPLTSSMFNELTTLSVNNGLPRDAAILAVNSMLQAKGYTYNPITKGYVATNQTAPATQKDIAGNPVTTDGGKFSKDSWENYKQKTIARGGKRTWIRGGGRSSEAVNTSVSTATGSNVPNSTGNTDSIWRIG